MTLNPLLPLPGFTIRELARRWRKSREWITARIRNGELAALNLASAKCGRPQYRVTPEAVLAFEQGRAAAVPKPAPRRKRRPLVKDYYPD